MGKKFQDKRWIPPSQRKVQKVPYYRNENVRVKGSFLEGYMEYLSLFRKLMYELVLVTLSLIIFISLYFTIIKKEIILDPITVPKKLINLGYTSSVVTEKILDEARNIGLEAQKLSKNNSWHNEGIKLGNIGSADISVPDIVVPTVNITMRNIVRYMRKVFDTPATYLSGSIVETENGLIFTLRNITDTNTPAVQINFQGDLDDLLQKKSGEALLRVAKPSVLAIHSYHKFDNEKDSLKKKGVLYENMMNNIRYCLKYLPSNDDTLAYKLWGIILAKDKRYDESIDKYRQAIKIDPEYGSAYNTWGSALSKLGRYDEAIEKYRLATVNNPGGSPAYTGWGNALAKLKRYDEAIDKYCQAAAKSNRKGVYAYTGWGNALVNLKRYDEAIVKYNQAAKNGPKYANVYNGWGKALARLKRYDEAIEKYRQAIEYDPKYASAYNNWGNVLAKLKRYDEAIEKYRKAIEIDPEYDNAHKGLDKVLDKLKRSGEAIGNIANNPH